jgi:hypothetical protein
VAQCLSTDQSYPYRRGELVLTKSATHQFAVIAAAVGLLVVAVVAATILYQRDDTQSGQDEAAPRQAPLASEHSPTLGDSDAKVHIVEIRLSVRHVSGYGTMLFSLTRSGQRLRGWA